MECILPPQAATGWNWTSASSGTMRSASLAPAHNWPIIWPALAFPLFNSIGTTHLPSSLRNIKSHFGSLGPMGNFLQSTLIMTWVLGASFRVTEHPSLRHLSARHSPGSLAFTRLTSRVLSIEPPLFGSIFPRSHCKYSLPRHRSRTGSHQSPHQMVFL